MIDKDTLLEDIVKIPGVIEYFIEAGISPVSCSGAFPMTVGRLLEMKKVANVDAFLEGLRTLEAPRRKQNKDRERG